MKVVVVVVIVTLAERQINTAPLLMSAISAILLELSSVGF